MLKLKNSTVLFVCLLTLLGCSEAVNDGFGSSSLTISVEKLEPVILNSEHCDVIYKITNVSDKMIDSDSVKMLAVDENGVTSSSVLINIANVRPGRSESGSVPLTNIPCREVSRFTSLSAYYSDIEPDEGSTYPIE